MEKTIKDLLIFNNVNNYFDDDYENKLISYSKININKFIEMSENLFKLNNEIKKSNNQRIIVEIYLIKISLIFKDINQNNDTTSKKQESSSNIDIVNDRKIEIIENNNKPILINNALYGANKNLKLEFLSKYDEIKDYLTNKDYNNIASLLIKGSPEVVSDKNLIFTFKNNFEVLLFEQNKDEIIKFLKLLYKKKYNIVAITYDEWVDIKEEYKNNIKNGIEYKYIEEIKEKTVKKKSEFKENIENIFGEDIIKED